MDPDLKSGLSWSIPSMTEQNASLSEIISDLKLESRKRLFLTPRKLILWAMIM